MFVVGFAVEDLDVVEVAFVGVLQLVVVVVLAELQVDLVLLLDGDGPQAVDGQVVDEAVLLPVLGDVVRADKVLEAAGLEDAGPDVGDGGQRVLDVGVHGLEAGVLDRGVGVEAEPQSPPRRGYHRRKVIPAKLS